MTAPDAGPDPPRLSRAERLAVLGIWVGLGLLESGKAILEQRLSGWPASWTTGLVGNLPWWLAWAALTPLTIALTRRVRPGLRRPGAWLVHGAAAVGLSLAHHLVVGTLYYFTVSRGMTSAVGGTIGPMTLTRQLHGFFGGYFVLNVLTYGAIVASYLGWEFHRRYREGELKAARLESAMHAARLDALRMELNPHFLFNTLNAVAGLVRKARGEEAVRMLARLADLLRSTLEDARDPEIPLEKELELLDTYLAIERIRFGERLSTEVRADADARAALVPPLILQPLVENAVRHGVARHEGPARIEVNAAVDGPLLRVAVTNTGPEWGDGPRSPAREGAAALRATGHGDEAEGGAQNGLGLGLGNTRERLRHAYGPGASLVLETRSDGGCRVTMLAPLRRGSNGARADTNPDPEVAGT
jgi:hypothetical protein